MFIGWSSHLCVQRLYCCWTAPRWPTAPSHCRPVQAAASRTSHHCGAWARDGHPAGGSSWTRRRCSRPRRPGQASSSLSGCCCRRRCSRGCSLPCWGLSRRCWNLQLHNWGWWCSGGEDLLTCAALNELSSLIGPAEGGHKDLVEAAGCERRKGTFSHTAAQRERREHFHVVEKQLHFVMVHVTLGCIPHHLQLLCATAR